MSRATTRQDPHMNSSDQPTIVRVYEASSKDAAMRQAAREAYEMTRQGYEITAARWSGPVPRPDQGATRRAVSGLFAALHRPSPVTRSTGLLVVTWTQTADAAPPD
jgi:hypothetical protein